MVLVHGGGFTSGCRSTLQKEASDIASDPTHPYVVVAVDYRLTTDPGIGGPCPAGSADPYCGWTMWSAAEQPGCASAVPNGTGSPGPMLADIKAAVDFVNNHFSYAGVPMAAPSSLPALNGQLAMVGSSAGGYLVQLAASLASGYPCYWSGTANLPVAVAAWSGGEVSYRWNDPGNGLYGTNYACQTAGVVEGAAAGQECQLLDQNLTCQSAGFGSSGCDGLLQASSVYQNYQMDHNDADIPVFFANSGCEGRNYHPPEITGCRGGPYQGIDIQHQYDFNNMLAGLQQKHHFPPSDYFACEVPGSGHAAAYLYNQSCDNPGRLTGSNVLTQTLSFLAPFAGN